MTARRWSAALLLSLVCAATLNAQTKDKEEKLAPPTDRELKASENNLKQIGLAMHIYHDAMGSLPNNGPRPGDKSKHPVSWRVHLLPYMEEEKLYKEYKFDEAWDSESNKKLIEKMPKLYAPIRVKTKEKGQTFYQGFDGPDTVFEAGKKIGFRNISDGMSNTIAFVEAGEPVVWTKPEDIKFDASKDLPKLGGLFDGDFHVVLMDGSVRLARGAKLDAKQLKLMVTKGDGNVIGTNALGDGK